MIVENDWAIPDFGIGKTKLGLMVWLVSWFPEINWAESNINLLGVFLVEGRDVWGYGMFGTLIFIEYVGSFKENYLLKFDFIITSWLDVLWVNITQIGRLIL